MYSLHRGEKCFRLDDRITCFLPLCATRLCARAKELLLQQRATCVPCGQHARSSAARKPLLTVMRFEPTVPLGYWHPAEHLGTGTARLHPEQSTVWLCGGCLRCWHPGGWAHLRAQNHIAVLIVLLVKQSEKRSRCCAKISNDVNYCSVHFFSLLRVWAY